jgi:NAD(P)-dependent dehydrogenase (short-subunit alcohol dehydrogenase family)
MRLKNKVAIVAGAGASGAVTGNGQATAVLFAREGAKVLCARRGGGDAHRRPSR